MSVMAKKRKPKRFSKVEAVKALARERVGSPPTGQVIPDRRQKKADKHKPTLEEILSGERT